MPLNKELAALRKSAGASLVGFADLREIDPKARDGFPFGIPFAVALEPRIISEIREGPTKSYVEECRRADSLLDTLGLAAARFIIDKDYRAQPRTKPGAEYPENLTTRLPQKTVASRAGLGWIGKCALLITEEFGSAVRLGYVLTDDPLTTNKPINTSRCHDCQACVEVCPAQALTGKDWHIGIERNALLDAFACQKTARDILTKRTGGEIQGRTFCGMCIAACPLTQKYLNGNNATFL
jgi:epoxyqueuosine reductase